MTRTTTLLAGAIAVLGAAAAVAADGPAPAPAPAAQAAPAAPAPTAADAARRVNGRVSTVDTKAGTITVTSFRTQTDTTFKVTDATKYFQDVSASQDDIKVGDTLRLFGMPSDDGKSISPRRVSIVSAADLADPAYTGNFVPTQGVVATVKPALTITTADNKTLTVDLSGGPRITKSVDGAAADVQTDRMVNAIVTGPDGSLVASKVHVTIPAN